MKSVKISVILMVLAFFLSACDDSKNDEQLKNKSGQVMPDMRAEDFSVYKDQTPCEKAHNCQSLKQVIDERKQMKGGVAQK